MVCSECGKEFCFEHGGAHPNRTCAEYEQEHQIEIKANAVFLDTNTKQCPNCQAPTQKNKGCNHMTCLKCKAGWCWICGVEIGNNTIPRHYAVSVVGTFLQSYFRDIILLTILQPGQSSCAGKQFDGGNALPPLDWNQLHCCQRFFSSFSFFFSFLNCISTQDFA
jgi:hypothetical protein